MSERTLSITTDEEDIEAQRRAIDHWTQRLQIIATRDGQVDELTQEDIWTLNELISFNRQVIDHYPVKS